MTLRVMFVVPDLRHGGAERHVVTLAPAMDRRRFSVSVVCLGQPGQLFDDVVAAGVSARALRRTKRQFLHALAELVAEMRRARPDVVITRGYNAEMLGRIGAVLAGVPRSAIWVHNCSPLEDRSPLRALFDRLLEPVTSAYLGVARAQLPYLTDELGYPEHKVMIVRNGVDPDRFTDRCTPSGRTTAAALGVEDGDAVVGVPAVLRPEKDHETLLRAFRLVVDEVPHARLLLIGGGPLRPDLERTAADLGIAGRVIFAGARDDVADLMTVVDVIALGSRSDCFPLALLEGMATGAPVVATAVGAIPEIVVDGETGTLVPPGEPAELAAGLIAMLLDPVRARAMGAAGRHRVTTLFSLEGSVRHAEEAIERIAVGSGALADESVRTRRPRMGRR